MPSLSRSQRRSLTKSPTLPILPPSSSSFESINARKESHITLFDNHVKHSFNSNLNPNIDINNNVNTSNTSNTNNEESISYTGSFTPRTLYSQKKSKRESTSLQMMMHMDALKVQSVQRHFELAGGGVDVTGFVRIMQKHLPDYSGSSAPRKKLTPEEMSGERRLSMDAIGVEDYTGMNNNMNVNSIQGLKNYHGEVVADLVELFREVDINGDEMMEWDEFTRFIVEKASHFQSSIALDSILPYSHNSLYNAENIDIRLRQRHVDTIDHVCSIDRNNQFAVIESHSKDVSIYNSLTGTLVKNLRQNAVPLALCHVDSHNCVVSSCADMTVNVWNIDGGSDNVNIRNRYKLRNKWPTKHAMMSLSWVDAHDLLYAGSTIGEIGAWSLEDREEKATLIGHDDIVMDMICMSGLNNVVSASLDTTVRIWDTYTEVETMKLSGHNKGVFSLSYNAEHRFIVSAGFDHDAYVWSPFVNALLFRLEGHTSSLVGCQCIEGTNELITADISGVFKVWDLRNFMCSQTFTSEVMEEEGGLSDLSNLSSFRHVKLPRGGGDAFKTNNANSSDSGGGGGSVSDDYRIICGTKRLFYFDQYRAINEPVTDELSITIALFNSVSLTIFTAAGKSAKVWDAVLGNVKCEFKEIASCDITCACLDDRQRKFIIGDVNGNIAVYNYSNGALMKKLSPFPDLSSVASLIYCTHAKVVLAASSNGVIRIYDELDPEHCVILREFDSNYKHRTLTVIKYCHDAGMVVSAGGTEEGIKFWDFETGKCLFEFEEGKGDASPTAKLNIGEANLHGHEIEAETEVEQTSILTICPLEKYPLMAVSYTDGTISIFGMHHAHPRIRHAKILTFSNLPPTDATYDGENGQEYPLLHMANLDLDGRISSSNVVKNGNNGKIDKKLTLRRRSSGNKLASSLSSSSSLNVEEEDDPEWLSKPRFSSPRASLPLPACSVVWEEDEEVLYTGDDSGRIRKWSLRDVFKELGELGLDGKTEGDDATGSTGNSSNANAASPAKPRRERRNSVRMHGKPSFLSTIGDDFKGYIPPPTFAASKVKFVWSMESHDDLTHIELTPHKNYVTSKSLLSYSADRTVKMWTCDGRPMGVLLIGVDGGVKNSAWDFQLDVGERQRRDDGNASVIIELLEKDRMEGVESSNGIDGIGNAAAAASAMTMRKRRKSKTKTKDSLSARTGSSFSSDGSQTQSQGQNQSDTQTPGNNIRTIHKLRSCKSQTSTSTSCSSSSNGNSDPATYTYDSVTEEYNQRHMRVLNVLADMQTMSALSNSTSHDNNSNNNNNNNNASSSPGKRGEDIQRQNLDLETVLSKAGRHAKSRVPRDFKMNYLKEEFSVVGGASLGMGIGGSKMQEEEEEIQRRVLSKDGRGKVGKLPLVDKAVKASKPRRIAPPSVVPPSSIVDMAGNNDGSGSARGFESVASDDDSYMEVMDCLVDAVESMDSIGENPFGGGGGGGGGLIEGEGGLGFVEDGVGEEEEEEETVEDDDESVEFRDE